MANESYEFENVSPDTLRRIGEALIALATEIERGTAGYKTGSIILSQQQATFDGRTNDGRLELATVAHDGPFVFGTLTITANLECWTGCPQPNA